jgi:hypothetical protein
MARIAQDAYAGATIIGSASRRTLFSTVPEGARSKAAGGRHVHSGGRTRSSGSGTGAFA